MKIGLAQIDTRIGDFPGNLRRILDAVRAAAAQGAEIVVLPELAVTGYPPRDLLLDPAFVARAVDAVLEVAQATAAGPPVVAGAPLDAVALGRAPFAAALGGAKPPLACPGHPGLWNAAVVLAGGGVAAIQGKRLLPAYDVFHEPRWFVPAPGSHVVELAGRVLGLLVCEDLWDDGHTQHPGEELRAAGASVLLAVAASPFRHRIVERRLAHAVRVGGPLVHVNAVGANDELVFDGGSFALDADGRLVARLPSFAETVAVVELQDGRADRLRDSAGSLPSPAATLAPELAPEQALFGALCAGVRGFVEKNGLPGAVLGLSGGIDSALVACVAAEALGPDRVTALALPGRHTHADSTRAARELASALGIRLELVEMAPLHAAARRALGPLLDDSLAGRRADENLQARLRMLALAAWINRHGGLLLNTSNKTELSLGYGTLWGDLAGTLGVIGDLTKTEVYAVARWLHHTRGLIPRFAIERPPSAELAPEQVDPFDYDRVAPAVEALVQGLAAPGDVGHHELTDLARMVRSAEHKRASHGLVLKVSERAFGSGRLMPVTRAF
ncbi:MAG: NAD(+) synthase [Vicinamibacteria bacterium]